MSFMYRLYHYIARILFILLTRRREIVGLEHVPKKGPLILVGNHFSLADPIMVFAYFPRQVHFMAKIEVFQFYPLKWMAPLSGAFPVRRGKVDRTALRQAEELLRQGRIVGIYPEGTRSRNGTIQDARAGVVLLAQRSGALILPIATSGTERIFPERFPRYHRVQVRMAVGTPFRLEDLVTEGEEIDRHMLANRVMEQVTHLLPPTYRTKPLTDQPSLAQEA